jgi:hypothetical protein
MTNVYLHHWIAEIDNAMGFFHTRTLARQEILNYVESLSLASFSVYDRVAKDQDPFNEKTRRRFEKYYLVLQRKVAHEM